MPEIPDAWVQRFAEVRAAQAAPAEVDAYVQMLRESAGWEAIRAGLAAVRELWEQEGR